MRQTTSRKADAMPHVIVKMYPGRSEEVKVRLAKAIVEDLKAIVQCADESVSVAIVDVPASRWTETVYEPDIVHCPGKLYKKPGYAP